MKIFIAEYYGGRTFCRWCEKPIAPEDPIKIEFNSVNKIFFHKKCYPAFKKAINSFTLKKKFLEVKPRRQ